MRGLLTGGGVLFVFLLIAIALVIVVQFFIRKWKTMEKIGKPGWFAFVNPLCIAGMCDFLYGNPYKVLLYLVPFYRIYFAFKLHFDMLRTIGVTGVRAFFCIILFDIPFYFSLGNPNNKINAQSHANGFSYLIKKMIADAIVMSNGGGSIKNLITEGINNSTGMVCTVNQPPVVIKEKEVVTRVENGDEFSDVFCPYCGKKNAYPKWQVMSGRMVCPDCNTTFDEKGKYDRPTNIPLEKNETPVSQTRWKCPKCGLSNSAERKTCIYCGTPKG